MTIAAAIRTLLLTFPPVTAIVGQRIYVMLLPQSPTLPAVRIQHIDEREPLHLRGVETLRVARVQVDSIAMEGSAADTLDLAVHGATLGAGLCAYRGTVADLAIACLAPVDVGHVYNPIELRQYKVARDYLAWYRVR